MQAPPFAPRYPSLQTQAVMALLPMGEFEFAGQGAHGSWPLLDLYVPAGQAGQVNDGTHSVLELLPMGEVKPPGHAVHDVWAIVLYVPAAQVVQLDDAVTGACVPAGHGSHGPPTDP
jgi:hypothetical protein